LKGENEEKLREVAQRISEAFRRFGGFIYQRELDSPEIIGKVIRESGIGLLVQNKLLDSQRGIYALTPNDRGCRTECIYGGPCEPSDRKCLEKCMEECRSRLIQRIVEALEKYAKRAGKHAG
jgi:hypothetical protein